MKKAIIPQTIIQQLLKLDADKEQMGVLLPENPYETKSSSIIFDKIMLRYDSHPDNDTCKLNNIVFDEVSFHTHPKVCYEMYKTDRGWPSVYDMQSFLEIDKIRILIIVSVEGIYLLVKKKKNTEHLSEGLQKIYNTRFKKVGKDILTIEKYLQEVNEYLGDYAKVYLVDRTAKPGSFNISFT